MKDEKTIREGIRQSTRTGAHLRRDDTPSEPGLPEAVNLEREEPITDAARRRDAFEPGEPIPERAVRAERGARSIARGDVGRGSPQSETTSAGGGINEQSDATAAKRRQADELDHA